MCLTGVIATAGEDKVAKALEKQLKPLIRKGCVLVADRERALFRYPRRCNPRLVPASVLKIVTSLAALHFLGPEFRFQTKFFLSPKGALGIRGYGDPMLISEEWLMIAGNLADNPEIPRNLAGIFLDDSVFSNLGSLPGPRQSLNPYDAPNGALVSNFNTIHVRKMKNGNVLSAEEQTPLTRHARTWSRNLKPGVQRVRIPEGAGNALQYSGELFREFLRREGFQVRDEKIRIRAVRDDDLPVYTHSNTNTLREVIAAMMLYSNNFIANQLLLSIGMSVHGLPATPEKGLRVLRSYMRDQLGLDDKQFRIVEGSGLSRKNLLTPTALWAALREFYPHRSLLPEEHGTRMKTGTLGGIYSLAGYLPGTKPRFFVILLNQPKNHRDAILSHLLKAARKGVW